MNVQLPNGCVHLAQHRHLQLFDADGATLYCLTGTVWITQDNDPRDIVLEPGERFVLDRDGLALVQAIDNSNVCLFSPPANEARGSSKQAITA